MRKSTVDLNRWDYYDFPMSYKITLRVGKEYEGPRNFSVPPKDDKSEPRIEGLTPKLAIPTGSLPTYLEGFQEPKKLLQHGADFVALRSLEYVQPGISTPWAMEVKLRVAESGYVITAPNGTVTRALELGDMGNRDQEGIWRVDGYVFDDAARHRCEILMSDTRPEAKFDAVKFVKDHHHKNLDPKPLKP